jgi:hypothetical protein
LTDFANVRNEPNHADPKTSSVPVLEF